MRRPTRPGPILHHGPEPSFANASKINGAQLISTTERRQKLAYMGAASKLHLRPKTNNNNDPSERHLNNSPKNWPRIFLEHIWALGPVAQQRLCSADLLPVGPLSSWPGLWLRAIWFYSRECGLTILSNKQNGYESHETQQQHERFMYSSPIRWPMTATNRTDLENVAGAAA